MTSIFPPRRSQLTSARRWASVWLVLTATAASCSSDRSPSSPPPGGGGAGAGGDQTGGGGAPTGGVSNDGGAVTTGGAGGETAGGAGAAGGVGVGGNGGAAVVPTDGKTPPGAPIRLTVGDREHSPNADHVPLFGWWPQDADGNEKQTAYQIKVTQRFGGELVWDSGKVVSEQQSHVPYAGDTALSSGGSYAWTVTTWDATDQMSPESEPAFFDVGLNDSDWDANWIRRSSNEADDYTMARAELSVGASPVVRARAYVAAVHQYVLYAGGQEVERGLAFAHPDQGYYQATDITEQVTAGQPLAIGVIYHWYGSGQGRPAGQRGLLVRVVVDHEDGSQDVLVTDSSWRVRRASQWRTGAPKRNGDGSDYVEQIDARQVPAGWTEAGYDASDWEAPQVIGMHPASPFTHLNAQEPRVAQIPIKPVSVTEVGGDVVADFGNVIPARPRVQFASGSAGRAVNMSGGYLLAGGGNVNTSTAANQDTDLSFDFTQAAGATVFEAYTHVGFRYLQIPDPGETLTADNISAFIEHTDAPADLRATFESSDETLNAVFAMLSRSAIYGVQGQFVDTPTREKGQFLGDSVSISYATMRGHHERDSTEKAIFEFVDSQRRHWSDGRLNAVYPNGDGARDIPDYTLMFVTWIWQYYLETGNKTLLEEVYPVLVNIKDYALRYRNDGTGLIHNLAGGSGDYQYGIIDWPIPGRFGFDMNTVARTPVNIQTVDVLRKVALAARALGRPESEAEGYEQQAAELTTAINTLLRRADGVYIDGLASVGNPSSHASQHANSYAIAFGVVPADGLGVVADYVESLGMQQGPMTSHWLLRGLGEAEKEAALLERLTDESELGWAKILADGGTFTWESWTARAEGHSESHSWGAQVLVDVLEYLLGVRLAAPGASQIDIVPPKTVLDSAKGSVFTQRGEVYVEWQRPTPTTFELTVKVPVNVRARVLLPTAEEAQVSSSGTGMPQTLGLVGDRVGFDVGSGTTSFTIAAP